MIRRVLIVDDDRAVREALMQTLQLEELNPLSAGSFVEAKDHITREFDGVILSDMRMPGRDGFHLLGYVQEVDPELPVVLLTGEGDIPMAVKAMGEGAFDFLEKPSASEALVRVIKRALKARWLVLENRRLTAKVRIGEVNQLIAGISGERGAGLAEQMADVEKALLVSAMQRHHGKASAAATALNLPRKTLYDKLARYEIRPEDFRD
ncbi:response regulator [Lentibacter algarum]|uniref:sigma-54-dependent Fis family transcriptional regulator n=1 Tax=Lentibacter algarum TaxID=576131 RepID=UPI001C093047|nr:sigma-54-dependent Fis family transcriptional regulator [Lentibacter algarum]MBU2982582.1 response regulator [Lentibacter algarum]